MVGRIHTDLSSSFYAYLLPIAANHIYLNDDVIAETNKHKYYYIHTHIRRAFTSFPVKYFSQNTIYVKEL